MNVDLGVMAERIAAREAIDQRARVAAVEDLARRLAWGPAVDKKVAAEVERLSAEEVRALDQRVAGLRRLRELQSLAARALELRAAAYEAAKRQQAAIAEHQEHGSAAGRRLLSDPTLGPEEIVRLRRLAQWPDPRPLRGAEEAADDAERALAQVLDVVPADVAQAYRDAQSALVRTEAEPARLRRVIAELAEFAPELERMVKHPAKPTLKAQRPVADVLLPGEVPDEVDEELKEKLEQLERAPELLWRRVVTELRSQVAALEAQRADAPKLIELARQKHRAAFQAVVTWGRA